MISNFHNLSIAHSTWARRTFSFYTGEIGVASVCAFVIFIIRKVKIINRTKRKTERSHALSAGLVRWADWDAAAEGKIERENQIDNSFLKHKLIDAFGGIYRTYLVCARKVIFPVWRHFDARQRAHSMQNINFAKFNLWPSSAGPFGQRSSVALLLWQQLNDFVFLLPISWPISCSRHTLTQATIRHISNS